MIILPLDDPAADLATAGGKGMSLARLARAGLPVPRGFHVTTAAYRDFVTSTGLAEEIATALRGPNPADVIAMAFAAHALPEGTVEAVTAAYDGLGSIAVRSSATAEDLPELSFAGQHDSFLNVSGVDGLLDAIRRCWASLWTERAIAYREGTGIAHEDVALAVVVQELVPADAAGVLFTANPLSGARDELVVNATWGLGEALVGGQVTPDTYVVRGDEIVERRIGDKSVRTVRVDGGTTEEPVPADQRTAPVLDDAGVRELAAVGRRIHELYGTPMDIEWALHSGQLAVLQARPITTLPEVWNDTLRGDYLWTSTNLGEAIPSVMTPITWSVAEVLTMPPIGPHPVQGNIGGRFYLNLSASLAMAQALGLGSFTRKMMERTMGRIPVDVPRLPMSRLGLLRAALSAAGRVARQSATYRRRLPALLAETPAKCESIVERVTAAADTATLLRLWESDVESLLWESCRILEAGARQSGADKLGPALTALVGEADATLLTSGMHGDDEDLVSLGPVLGLARLRRGETTREEYLRAWGHRCADECELSAPRPREDPTWLDGQLAAEDGGDPKALLERQAAARAKAWQRFAERHPGKVARFRARVEKAAEAGRKRELARSEMVRTFWTIRAFLARAGELTSHGDDVFFLTKEEVLTVLRGDDTPWAAVGARRAAYDRYRALPPYPRMIRGRFDPAAWAADPNRRTDFYDESVPATPVTTELTGFPGAAGVVDGTARVVSTVEEGQALRTGEILVTSVTNIGWTPLFPRAAAVVTDIGAPLSHAAIVARELGIPAVVGCGTATTRIATGDRVRVDGTRGTVTVLTDD
jgi:rifampicin phosphotransferase